MREEEQHRKRIDERRRAVENSQIVDEKGIHEDLLQQSGWRDILAQRG